MSTLLLLFDTLLARMHEGIDMKICSEGKKQLTGALYYNERMGSSQAWRLIKALRQNNVHVRPRHEMKVISLIFGKGNHLSEGCL